MFWEIWRHQNFILRLTDLYIISSTYQKIALFIFLELCMVWSEILFENAFSRNYCRENFGYFSIKMYYIFWIKAIWTVHAVAAPLFDKYQTIRADYRPPTISAVTAHRVCFFKRILKGKASNSSKWGLKCITQGPWLLWISLVWFSLILYRGSPTSTVSTSTISTSRNFQKVLHKVVLCSGGPY